MFFFIYTLIMVLGNVASDEAKLPDLFNVTDPPIPEDGRLNFTELSAKYGRPAEEHTVTTEDGYILTMFHIPGTRGPVFLQHGLLDSSTTFILRGNNSLAFKLAEAGYDVWLGNMRGNRYSRRHKKYNPDKDKEFWNFSMHELGNNDIPAMIDYILEKKNVSQLTAIGHSQGNAVFYVLGASKPEYNKKIKLMIALAPVCFLNNVRSPVSVLVALSPQLNNYLLSIGQEEVLGDNSTAKDLYKQICSIEPFNYAICGESGILWFAGMDRVEFEKEFMNILIWHYPQGTSRRNLLHLSQIGLQKRFQRFDYGAKKNVEVYGVNVPPKYNLSQVSMKVELIVGENDNIATVEDVKLLREELPYANYQVVDRKRMNHLDFIWGKHMEVYLYPLIFGALDKLQ